MFTEKNIAFTCVLKKNSNPAEEEDRKELVHMDGDMEQLGRLAGGDVDQLQACRPVSLSRAACQDMQPEDGPAPSWSPARSARARERKSEGDHRVAGRVPALTIPFQGTVLRPLSLLPLLEPGCQLRGRW